ncbi:MAG: small subunit ribosomal protein S3Ae [Methanobacteriota archaeon]|jgi:small subunit ribosomal protein S3Ae|uniref:Small ribosomal subunit protein eS1 n=1 Tax=Halorutilus salinus TaxID=2487751 RepID=A0A9Q4C3Q1_9EURY|nr:30S ribosomal protein S3ae [Halorutilus salinus]MCX2819300.1 30S ribosomal protein S3ae [Halorutilus salinus]
MSSRQVSKSGRGKDWYTVLASQEFDRAELGETPADEPETLHGRTVETTLGEITDDFSENNTKVKFQVEEVGKDAVYTRFVGHELARDYVRSLVRRGTSKIGDVITVRTTDDYRVQLQPVAFTAKKADDSQEKSIRRRMNAMVREKGEDLTFEELVDAVVEGRLSSAVYNEAKEIYPVRRVEVQKTKVAATPEQVHEEEEVEA